MDEEILQKTTIRQYEKLLKDGTDKGKIEEIGDLLNSKVSIFTGGFDLHLFQLQKDLLLIQCKYFLAVLEFDENKQAKYAKRIEDLKKAISQKTPKSKKEETTPYKSFLEWLLTLKKYYGSDIDKDNDLLYLIYATEQMMKYYKSQEEHFENLKQRK